jgi:hypothetical protein
MRYGRVISHAHRRRDGADHDSDRPVMPAGVLTGTCITPVQIPDVGRTRLWQTSGMTRCICALVILLAGCPMPGASPQQPAQPASVAPAGGAGCPTADKIYVASYLASDDPAQPALRTGWVLPLSDQKVDTLAGQPEYTAIDAATASARGVPPAPPDVWLAVPGKPPCHAVIGSYYAAAVDGPISNVTYGVELDGCAAPPREQQDDAEALALVSEQAPTGCQLLAPQPAAERVGETDAQKHWQRPTKQTPLPPAIAAIVPPHDCRPPGCETLWAFGQVDVAGRPVAWAGAVNWLTIPPGASPDSRCDWKADTFAGFFVAGSDGRAVRLTEGQDHPLLLTAVLADPGGAKVLVAEGPGEYTTYDLTAAARVARHLVWLRLPPEAYALDERIDLGCGGDAATGPPTGGPPR